MRLAVANASLTTQLSKSLGPGSGQRSPITLSPALAVRSLHKCRNVPVLKIRQPYCKVVAVVVNGSRDLSRNDCVLFEVFLSLPLSFSLSFCRVMGKRVAPLARSLFFFSLSRSCLLACLGFGDWVPRPVGQPPRSASLSLSISLPLSRSPCCAGEHAVCNTLRQISAYPLGGIWFEASQRRCGARCSPGNVGLSSTRITAALRSTAKCWLGVDHPLPSA